MENPLDSLPCHQFKKEEPDKGIQSQWTKLPKKQSEGVRFC